MNYEENFDKVIHDALKGDEMPSETFTDRVMEQVRRTPQKRGVSRRKILVSVAACLAVLVVAYPVIRLGTMRAGGSAGSTMAFSREAPAPAAAEAADEEPSEEETYDLGDGFMKQNTEPAEAKNEERESATSVFVIDDATLCADLRLWLEENGFPPTEGEEQVEFTLSEEQIAALEQAFPEVILPAGVDTLRLEG